MLRRQQDGGYTAEGQQGWAGIYRIIEYPFFCPMRRFGPEQILGTLEEIDDMARTGITITLN